MLELQEATKRKKDTILKGVAEHLENDGKNVVIGSESVSDYTCNETRESLVEVSDSDISKIRILAYDYGTSNTTFRYRYEVAHDGAAFPGGMNKTIYTRMKPIKENKVMGIFSGTVTGVRWEGQKVAELLNADTDLNAVLMELVKQTGDTDIQIYLKSPEEIEILGPKFTAPFSLLAENALMDRFVDRAVDSARIDIFEKIGNYVRQVVAEKMA